MIAIGSLHSVAYTRMQATCRLNFTIVCRLHASLVRPRL